MLYVLPFLNLTSKYMKLSEEFLEFKDEVERLSASFYFLKLLNNLKFVNKRILNTIESPFF